MVLVLIPLLLIVMVAVARWAWRHQIRNIELLEPVQAPRPEPSRGLDPELSRAAEPEKSPEYATASPVLRWRRLRLVSMLGDGKTVILACRRHPRGRRDSAPSHDGRHLEPDDQTVVLRLGESPDAERARALLQRWCDEGTWLQIRPAPAGGAVELFDAAHASLRAPLAAA